MKEHLLEFVKREIAVINRTLAQHGVDAGTAPGWTLVAGSAFISYRLKLGSGVRVQAVERLHANLNEALSQHRRRATAVRLRYMPLSLEAPHPEPQPLLWSKAGIDVPPATMLAGRSYGYDGAQDERISLDATPHVLVGGMTGAGKSVLLNMLLLSLMRNTSPAECRVMLVDLKNEDMQPLARLPHVERMAVTLAQATAAIDAVYTELQRRIVHNDGPRWVLAIDEYARLIGEAGALRQLQELLSVGRSKRLHVIAATQHPTAAVLGTLAKVNFPCRLIGRVADATTASVATGRAGSGAEQLPGRGAFLRVEGPDVVRVQVYYLDATGLRVFRHEIRQRWGQAAMPAPAVATTSSSALASVFAEFDDGQGGLRRGGLAAAIRVLCGPDAPTAGRAYVDASQQVQGHLQAWNAARQTAADASRKTSEHTSTRGAQPPMVIRGSVPRLLA